MPFQPLMAILSRHGRQGRGKADIEMTMPAESLAFGCTVIGDAKTGVSCVGFERPRYDGALRDIAWECLSQLGCTVFNDTLELVYASPDGAAELPADMIAAACGARTIRSAQQLWPGQLVLPIDALPLPALAYTNPNGQGPNLQLFDHSDMARKELTIEVGIRPAACNPGTLRVLRNLTLRVDAAMQDNPDYKPFYRYAHADSSRMFLESPRLTDHVMQATFVSSMPGEPEPTQPDFIADRGVYASAAKEAAALARHVQEKYQLTLDGDVATIPALSALLDKLHAFSCHDRSKHPPGTPFHSALAATWAVRAGCYLGEVIRLHVGGQWGHIERGLLRLPVVLTHSARLCFAQQQVLDHVINGEAANIASWFESVARNDVSPTPRAEDLANNIPASVGLLLDGDTLPHAGDIPRAALDFSVESLRHLDTYLELIAKHVSGIPGPALEKVILAAGAYLGEVVRINTPSRAWWRWVNYDDHVAAYPGFAKQRPREMGFMAFLDSREQTCYPIQHVGAYITGEGVLRTTDFALKVLGAVLPAQTLPAAIDRWPQDDVMAGELAHVRDTLATWRRMASKADYDAMRPPEDAWLRSDSLGEILTRRDLLLERGQVVWAALVQANSELFQEGPDNLPAALAYSVDPHFDGRPQALRYLARTLFAQRGTQAPPHVQRITGFLEDELERAYNIVVPVEMTEHETLISAFMVYRQDVPEGVLAGAWFPALTHPDTPALMIAPRRFWSPRLVGLWSQRVLEVEH